MGDEAELRICVICKCPVDKGEKIVNQLRSELSRLT
jgi:hypothetical protein